MTQGKSLLSTPSASFEEPFGMLEACHERMVRMLDLLARLREHVGRHGCDDQAREAARDVMRYFDQAAPQHHLDEELHVFPPLLARDDAPLHAVVRRLQQDHLAMETGWREAREVLTLVADAEVDRLQEEDEARLAAFAALYGDHLRAEDEVVYPAAAGLLGPQDRAAMGAEMARRRGIG